MSHHVDPYDLTPQVDGVRTVFTLPYRTVVRATFVLRNGTKLPKTSVAVFSQGIVLTSPPKVGDELIVYIRKESEVV